MLGGGEMPKISLTFVLDSNTLLISTLAITKLVLLGNNRLLAKSRWYVKFNYMLPTRSGKVGSIYSASA